MQSIKKTLMIRDGLTEAEAEAEVQLVRDEVQSCLDNDDMLGALDACEIVGLEPDYLDEIINDMA